MRKITMKRKGRSSEISKNSEPEDDDVQATNQDQEDDEESNANNTSTDSVEEKENGTPAKSKSKQKKAKTESDGEDSDSGTPAKSKSKQKKAKAESDGEDSDSGTLAKSKSKQKKAIAESDGEYSDVPEKRPIKKKSKKGRKPKGKVVEESNGTEDINDDEEYEVEEVIDMKTVKGSKLYLIRWKGYGEESDTWEPASTLDCPDLITKFLNSRKPDKKGKKRSSHSNNKPQKKAKGDSSDEEEVVGEYEVDRILEVHFKKNGKREFLVHWKGYNATDNTWEPEENMSCRDLIEKFMAKVDRARESDTRELRVNRKPTEYFTLSMQASERRLSRRNLGKQRTHYAELD